MFRRFFIFFEKSTRSRSQSLPTMSKAFMFLLLVYLEGKTMSRDIEVMNSGVMKMRGDDMMVVFFVTIQHHGVRARDVMATMIECCEKVTDDDVDCSVMQIHGQHLGSIQPGVTRNMTFLYPNIYGYNRKGFCTIDIWNRGEGGMEDSDKIRHKIDFDTSIRFMSEEIPQFLQGLYAPDKVPRCETTDLDPFDGCNPVNCRLKYSGLRDHYNRKRKRCQKVPVCVGDPGKELPDVVYIPLSNTCRNLEKAVSEKDLENLLKNKYDSSDSNDISSKMVNIQCHHGEIDVRTGLCICDKGWTSELFDAEAYNEGTPVYHMCDKKCHPDVTTKFNYGLFLIGFAIALWVVFFVMLCENCNYFAEFYRRPGGDDDEICYYRVGTQ